MAEALSTRTVWLYLLLILWGIDLSNVHHNTLPILPSWCSETRPHAVCPSMPEPAHVNPVVTLDRQACTELWSNGCHWKAGDCNLLLMCSLAFEPSLAGFYVLAGAFPWGLIALLRNPA